MTKKPAIVSSIPGESQVSNNIQSKVAKYHAIVLPNIKPSGGGGKLKDRNGRVSANAPNNISKNVSTVEHRPGQSAAHAKETNHNLEELTETKDAASKKGISIEPDFAVQLPEMSNGERKMYGEIMKTIGLEIPGIIETIGVANSHGMSHGRGIKNGDTIGHSVVLHKETTNKRISDIDNDECPNGQHVKDSTHVADNRGFDKMRLKSAQPVGYQTNLRRILEKEKNAKHGSQNHTDRDAAPPIMAELNGIPCQVTEWTLWENIPGTVLRRRYRERSTESELQVCPHLYEAVPREANTTVDCVMSEWSVWEYNNVTGCKARRRFPEVLPKNGGQACPDDKLQLQFGADCEYDGWSEWDRVQGITNCLTRRTKNAIVTPAGMTCAETSDEQTCVNCQMSEWNQWAPWVNNIRGVCLWQRTRTVVQTPSAFGDACLNTAENKACPDCEYGVWSQFQRVLAISECLIRRTRAATFTPTGTACDDTSEDQTCVNCQMSEWNQWAPWVNNIRGVCLWQRTRTVVQTPSAFGDPCLNTAENKACPDCIYEPWTAWSRSGAGCVMERTRNVRFQPQSRVCSDVRQTSTCVDCVWGTWGQYQEISSDPCDQQRTRTENPPASNGGNPCVGSATENRPCPIIITSPVDCLVSGWLEWKRLDSQGIEERIRRILVSPENGGEACPQDLRQTRNVDVECVVSQWSEYNRTPSAASSTRQRYILISRQNNGAPCPSLIDIKIVVTHMDCIVGSWSAWERHLNFPYLERSRPMLVLPNDAGVPCPKLFDFWSCSAPGQPIDDTGTAIVEHFFPTRPRDLLIIVDSSGSIPNSSYQLAKDLIVYLLEHMCGSVGQGVGQNRVALMQYSSTTQTIMDFHDSTDLSHVTTAVQTMGKAISNNMCTGHRLRYALLEVLLPEKGMRDPAEAPKQVIIFSDGCKNCGVGAMLAAQDLREVAEVFSVAFGPEKLECYTQLLNYASYPKYQHVFAVDQYLLVNDLISRMNNLLRTINPCS